MRNALDRVSPLYPFEGRLPVVDATAWVAPTAAVIGDVTIGPGANIWYHCVLRGDTNLLKIARNARTSPDMIDRFYARHLTAEMGD